MASSNKERVAKCDANKRANGFIPRKYYIHETNEKLFRQIGQAMAEPNFDRESLLQLFATE